METFALGHFGLLEVEEGAGRADLVGADLHDRMISFMITFNQACWLRQTAIPQGAMARKPESWTFGIIRVAGLISALRGRHVPIRMPDQNLSLEEA
ncbi:MAG: hypothetical protein ACREFT_18995 [Acetobacteraceae bacterium]